MRKREQSYEKEIDERNPCVCVCCKLYYYLVCANIKPSLYLCIVDRDLEDFHWSCSCCKSMFPMLENIATVVNDIQEKHEDMLIGLEERVSKVEKTTKSLEQTTKQEIEKNVTGMKTNILDNLRGDIDRLAESRNTELEDRKQRELNIIIFNLEWHNHDNGENNKKKR